MKQLYDIDNRKKIFMETFAQELHRKMTVRHPPRPPRANYNAIHSQNNHAKTTGAFGGPPLENESQLAEQSQEGAEGSDH